MCRCSDQQTQQFWAHPQLCLASSLAAAQRALRSPHMAALCVLNGVASKLVFSVWIAAFERCICGAMSETHPAVPMTGSSSSLRAAETVRLQDGIQLLWFVMNMSYGCTCWLLRCMPHANGWSRRAQQMSSRGAGAGVHHVSPYDHHDRVDCAYTQRRLLVATGMLPHHLQDAWRSVCCAPLASLAASREATTAPTSGQPAVQPQKSGEEPLIVCAPAGCIHR